MDNNKIRKRMQHFPNVITAFGLACGLFVIFKMSLSDISSQSFESIQGAAIFLLIAATADILDGAVARFMKVESEFGIFFDSISDSITFGVAPSVVILKSMDLGPDVALPLLIACMIFTLCGVLRLVRYSVEAHQHKEELNDHKTDEGKIFTGLPIPGAAAAAVSANLFFASTDCIGICEMTLRTRAYVLTVIMICLGYLMISHWKFPSLKALQFKIRAFPLIVGTVSATALLLYGILTHFALVFMIVSWLYIGLALFIALRNKWKGKEGG